MYLQYYQKVELKMRKYSKIILVAGLVTFALTQEKVCQHLGFGQAKVHRITKTTGEEKPSSNNLSVQKASLSSDDIYRWDEQSMNWVLDERDGISHLANYTS